MRFPSELPSPQDGPRWAIQVYDTTTTAGGRQIRALAGHLFEKTKKVRYARDHVHAYGVGHDNLRSLPDRIDVYGLPLDVETSDGIRVAECIEHRKAGRILIVTKLPKGENELDEEQQESSTQDANGVRFVLSEFDGAAGEAHACPYWFK
ncbi:hypothetical protein PG984_013461 [Apiospora sp. TS-2023a]